jgi:hypothetical protein
MDNYVKGDELTTLDNCVCVWVHDAASYVYVDKATIKSIERR